MKKVLSLCLSVFMVFSLCVPALAAVDIYKETSRIPVIIISGDGSTIVDKDGNELSKLSRLAGNKGEEVEPLDEDTVTQSVLNVVKPFILQGILTGNWEPYYEALQTEMTELFGDIVLDENGEPSNGSHLEDYWAEYTQEGLTKNRANSKGYYGITKGKNYQFYYDWRLDPIAIADQLKEYIDGVKKVTGCKEVAILTRCIGSQVTCAYLTKYGTEGIHGVGFDGVTCMGVEPIGEGISGKFKIDGWAIERVLADAESYGLFSLNDFVSSSIDLAVKSGLLDTMTTTLKYTVYQQIAQGATSALVLSSISYPSYWACVAPEHFDDALNYVFGEEGSEKRIKYAGLIEKITNYNDTVKVHIPELLAGLADTVNVGVISKYGSQLLPVCESRDMIADSFVSVKSSSFGATTGTVYEPLSDNYIATQTKKGLGKYISPDGYIDASTCIYPDYTWFIKGVRHSTWTKTEDYLLYTVITADKQLTVNDIGLTQFMVPTEENPEIMMPMTNENAKVENWDAETQAKERFSILGRLTALFEAFDKWLTQTIYYFKLATPPEDTTAVAE